MKSEFHKIEKKASWIKLSNTINYKTKGPNFILVISFIATIIIWHKFVHFIAVTPLEWG